MTRLPALALGLRDGGRMAAFERASGDPAAAQARVLARILAGAAGTAFGRDHGFGSIASPADYARAVPVAGYERFRPYVDRALLGEADVLHPGRPSLFQRTSGTTGQPKLVPAPRAWCDEMAAMTRLWVMAAVRDHPAAVAGRALVVTGAAVEERTAAGVPIGSASGLANESAPGPVRRRFAVPPAVALVEDPDQRYFLTMRFALAHDVTAVATANPTTLVRLSDVARVHADRLLDALAAGSPGVDEPAFAPVADARRARAELRAACRPAPDRARALAREASRAGALTPRAAWPRLALIGCWLGGSAGVHAGRLAAAFGDVPLRDLGLVATEGRLTLPLADGTPRGALCVDTTFFEFAPAGSSDRAVTMLAHELEDGRRYRVVVTGSNGLYRYDLHDVVEVRGFHRRTPMVAFLRKDGEFVSITGEKVHADQVLEAVRGAETATGVPVWQFRLVPDVDGLRHDLLVEPGAVVAEASARDLAGAFDRRLAELNVEYAAKRRSGRLGPPRVHVMRPGWSERAARAELADGRREQQFKWSALVPAWDGVSRSDVALTVDPLD
ncbi:MAG TPA: GH3 auxin-responsive promoter family protein [Terriglobales bacterium]|nr:GH3 auxin-responsive promoter family protein [Terriglobales bacterium]